MKDEHCLDGKTLTERASDRLMKRVDRMARTKPAEFAIACYQLFGIRYEHTKTKYIGRSGVDLMQTLSCFYKLQKVFGHVTYDMLYALMNTQIKV